jgi:hypothetical protein
MTRLDVPLVFEKATCFALYAFDVGLEIDIERCAQWIASERLNGNLRANRRSPRYFDYHPAPLRVTQEVAPIKIADFITSATVELVLYDFGGVAVTYAIPFQGPVEKAQQLSNTLDASDVLLKDARQRVETLVAAIRAVVARPHVADMVEDYVIIQAEQVKAGCVVDELPVRYAGELARVLRAEPESLSDEEIKDALACAISYSPEDLTLIDWYGALIFDQHADDVRAVLEFANLELLELRLLDHQLDDSLEDAYDVISERNWLTALGLSRSAHLARVGHLEVDGAILFERVSNAIKLLGDQYLARVYRLVAQRFHLSEWNSAILRKLDTIESLYKKINDRNANRRLELLEWIIIILIAFEIVWSLIKP